MANETRQRNCGGPCCELAVKLDPMYSQAVFSKGNVDCVYCSLSPLHSQCDESTVDLSDEDMLCASQDRCSSRSVVIGAHLSDCQAFSCNNVSSGETVTQQLLLLLHNVLNHLNPLSSYFMFEWNDLQSKPQAALPAWLASCQTSEADIISVCT